MKNKTLNPLSGTKQMMPMQLQFFAESQTGGAQTGGQQQSQQQQAQESNPQGGTQQQSQQQQQVAGQQQAQPNQAQQQTAQVQLSQEALNGMMAREKGEGRRNILSKLGLTDSAEDLKKFEAMAAILNPTVQTPEQTTLQLEQTKTLCMAQLKAEAMIEGAKPEFVEDLCTLAFAKINMQSYTDADIKTAMSMLKTKHSAYFNAPGATTGGTGQQQPTGGTGQPPGGGQGTGAGQQQSAGGQGGGYDPVARAKIAGQQRAKMNNKNSSYFK